MEDNFNLRPVLYGRGLFFPAEPVTIIKTTDCDVVLVCANHYIPELPNLLVVVVGVTPTTSTRRFGTDFMSQFERICI